MCFFAQDTSFRARYLVSRTIPLFAHDVALRARYGSSRKVSHFAHDIPRKTSRKMPRFAHGIPRKTSRKASRSCVCIRFSDLVQVLPSLAADVTLSRCCQNWRPLPPDPNAKAKYQTEPRQWLPSLNIIYIYNVKHLLQGVKT